MRTGAAARERAREKGRHRLSACYTVVTHDLWRAHFHMFDLSMLTCGIVPSTASGGLALSRKPRVNSAGHYVLGFLDDPGPTALFLPAAAYSAAIKVAIDPRCLQTRMSGLPLVGILRYTDDSRTAIPAPRVPPPHTPFP